MVNPFSTILGICYGKNISPLGLPPIYKLHDFIAKDNDMTVFFNVRNMLKMATESRDCWVAKISQSCKLVVTL